MIIVPDDPGPATPDEVFRARTQKVFDGDGFLAKLWNPVREIWIERVPFRFAFIDAPEIEQPFGSEARDYLASLIVGKELRLDPVGKEFSGYLPIDSFKRLLCMAFVTEQLDPGPVSYFLNGKCVNGTSARARMVTRNIELELIVNGWAWVTPQYEFDRKQEYISAEEDARSFRRGLWSADKPEPPWSFKRRKKLHTERNRGQGSLF